MAKCAPPTNVAVECSQTKLSPGGTTACRQSSTDMVARPNTNGELQLVPRPKRSIINNNSATLSPNTPPVVSTNECNVAFGKNQSVAKCAETRPMACTNRLNEQQATIQTVADRGSKREKAMGREFAVTIRLSRSDAEIGFGCRV